MLDAVILFRLYEFDACWKGNPTVVVKNLINMDSDGAKREVFKTNIIIPVKCLVWKELHITWTHQCVKWPLVELDNQLSKTIRFEEKMSFLQSFQTRYPN